MPSRAAPQIAMSESSGPLAPGSHRPSRVWRAARIEIHCHAASHTSPTPKVKKPSQGRFELVDLQWRRPNQAELNSGHVHGKQPSQANVQTIGRCGRDRLDCPKCIDTLWIFQVNDLVRSTFVGLSGLEPLTSALSGPARTPGNPPFTLSERPPTSTVVCR